MRKFPTASELRDLMPKETSLPPICPQEEERLEKVLSILAAQTVDHAKSGVPSCIALDLIPYEDYDPSWFDSLALAWSFNYQPGAPLKLKGVAQFVWDFLKSQNLNPTIRRAKVNPRSLSLVVYQIIANW